jgi:hypothetical protein
MANDIKNLIETLVEQELDEFNAVGTGAVAATGGSPLGMNMGPAHKTMWSGDKKKVQEANAISAGAGTLQPYAGNNLADENFNNWGETSGHRSDVQDFMWAGDKPGASMPKIRYIAEALTETITTHLTGIPVPQSEQEEDYLRETITKIVENVLDKMGLSKATASVRRGMIGGGEVYMDRHDSDKEGTKAVMAKVSKNLHRKPYSHNPPRMGIGGE